MVDRGYSYKAAILMSPLFFSMSHMHHAYKDQSIAATLFQACFTYVFGVYSGFIFKLSHSLLASTVLHSYCNIMGFPSL